VSSPAHPVLFRQPTTVLKLTHTSHSDTIANIERIEPALEGVPCGDIFGLVVYNLPGRDCAAAASNGELPVGAIDRYKTEFIDGAIPSSFHLSLS
jgi:cellulase/cellobiase CelA1